MDTDADMGMDVETTETCYVADTEAESMCTWTRSLCTRRDPPADKGLLKVGVARLDIQQRRDGHRACGHARERMTACASQRAEWHTSGSVLLPSSNE